MYIQTPINECKAHVWILKIYLKRLLFTNSGFLVILRRCWVNYFCSSPSCVMAVYQVSAPVFVGFQCSLLCLHGCETQGHRHPYFWSAAYPSLPVSTTTVPAFRFATPSFCIWRFHLLFWKNVYIISISYLYQKDLHSSQIHNFARTKVSISAPNNVT